MKAPVFRGVATALATPFKDGNLDLDAFEHLISLQLNAGIPALVVCGTTGESSTLTADEKITLVDRAVQQTAGRATIIAGVGTNDTGKSVVLAKLAEQCGADALLAVTPYYNKCTQEGLLSHYEAIADATELPLIVYNVPSRTGLNLLPETWQKLSAHPKINGLKEASGNISQAAKTISLTAPGAVIWSGNDDQIVPVMSVGGMGVISVLSNIRPRAVLHMTDACLKGDYTEAARLQLHYLPLIEALFSEVNPIPLKAALAELGICSDETRLPLTKMSKEKRETLSRILAALPDIS